MNKINYFEMYFIDKAKVPRLKINSDCCLFVADEQCIEVGNIIYVPVLAINLEVKKLTLVLGKLPSVTKTEPSHRYVICFGEMKLPQGIVGSLNCEMLK